MTKFLLPVALLVAAPALAATETAIVPSGSVVAAESPLAFERDGIRYVATVKTVGETRLISGHEVSSGKSFSLRERNGRVTGVYGVSAVSYTVR